MPLIKNWLILGSAGSYFILGEIFNDPRAPDGSTIRTSTIKRLDLIDDECETKNTLYKLGCPAKGTKVMNEKTVFVD